MTSRRLVLRSLRFYWRTHLATVLGCAVGSAVLVGALAVGDSVRGSLRALALARLGEVSLALAPRDRYFRADLAGRVGRTLEVPAATVLSLPASVSLPDGSGRANRVSLLGVDEDFWRLGGARPPLQDGDEDGVALNEALARELSVHVGDAVVVRAEKPDELPREAPLSSTGDSSVAFRATVRAIVSDGQFGRFGLQVNQAAPLNVFVPRAILAERVGLPGRANVALLGGGDRAPQAPQADQALRRCWQLDDAELELRPLPGRTTLELRTRRVFLEEAVIRAAVGGGEQPLGVLTYFVNTLKVGDRQTPYSMVSALGRLDARGQALSAASTPAGGLIPSADDRIVLNSWLAEDLQAHPGDRLEMTYWVLGPMRTLQERSADFVVDRVVDLAGPASDADLMPLFPGLSEAENCRDWKPGVAIDLDRIRPKDEEYWNLHRGTPKAFVTLAAGEKTWASRYGRLTAIRFPGRGEGDADQVGETILAGLAPADVALFFQPVRRHALDGAEKSQDFGQLFLGLSFFLIVAGLLLVGLLLSFTVEQRSEQTGLLLAVGFSPRRVRRLYLLEASVLAAAGTVAGVGLGVLYTRAVLWGLARFAPAAAGYAPLEYHAQLPTLALGGLAALVAEVGAVWLALHRQVRRSARELLTGTTDAIAPAPRRQWRTRLAAGIGALLVAGAVVVAGATSAGRGTEAAGAFFAAGAMLLVGGMALVHAWLGRLGGTGAPGRLTAGGLARRNAGRRAGRSLAVAALLACGSFLVVAVGANRQEGAPDPWQRDSGTGGFALMGESSLPVFQDLNTPAGRDAHNLPATMPVGFAVVPLRVRDGDEASCLNLNRAQAPRLYGLDPHRLDQRGAFRFLKTAGTPTGGGPWMLLEQDQPDGTVPAVGDEATVTYALGNKVGGTLTYLDERGRQFGVRIVGVISNSILQGGLVISERHFVERFPSEGGYRAFLVDCPPASVRQVSRDLSRGLEAVGTDVTPAVSRMAQFAAVENAYLSVFAVLGGLGMALGSVGLGLVVLRNVLERRGELALLSALGFPRARLVGLVFTEHGLLLAAGLICGVVSALVAVVPALRQGPGHFPAASMSVTLAGILVSGAAWTLLATLAALHGPLLPALRNE